MLVRVALASCVAAALRALSRNAGTEQKLGGRLPAGPGAWGPWPRRPGVEPLPRQGRDQAKYPGLPLAGPGSARELHGHSANAEPLPRTKQKLLEVVNSLVRVARGGLGPGVQAWSRYRGEAGT